MRKLRVLSGLLVVVMVLSALTTSVFAADSSSKVVLSDVPFDYMTNMKNRSLDSYNALSTPEKKLVYSIPEDVAETLTTEALLETILSNNFLGDCLAYDTFSQAVISKDADFQILELLSRNGINDVILKYIEKYSDSVQEYKKYKNEIYIKIQSSQILSNKETEIVNDVLCYGFLNELLDYNNGYLKNTIRNSRSLNDKTSSVLTKGGSIVLCYLNPTWSDWNMLETSAEVQSIYYYNTYKNKGAAVVSGIDPSFNCHSYAWHNPNHLVNNIWIPNAMAYVLECTVNGKDVSENQVRVGTIVGYFNSAGVCEHSAIVNELNSDGSIKNVASKWAHCQLFLHPLTECPYNISNIQFFNY